MALSGSTSFSVNRDELIKLSYQEIGSLEAGEDPTNEEYSDAAKRLNMMLKAYQKDGLDLWLIKEAILIPSKGTEEYSLGTAHASLSMNKTEMSTAGVSTDTIILVDSTSDMTKDDNVGLVLDDGTTQWTTVSSITNSTTFVAATALTGAIAVDQHVYSYTTKIDRPTQLKEVLRRHYDTRVDVPLNVMARTDYYQLSDKDQEGLPVNYYYDPQLTSSVLHVWNTADSNFAKNDVFVLLVKKPFDDMDAGTDDFEIPQEWYEPIMLSLAERLGPSNFYPIRQQKLLMARAELARDLAQASEDGSIFLQPS